MRHLILIAAGLAAVLVLPATRAHGESHRDRMLREGYMWHCDEDGDCRWRKRVARYGGRAEWTSREGFRCHLEIKREGAEAISEEDAKRSSERAWLDAVRFSHGERFMNLDQAGEVRYLCSRSSTNDGVLGKTAEAFGGVRMRCQITARPCSGDAKTAEPSLKSK